MSVSISVTLTGGERFLAADAPAITQRIGAALAQRLAERVAEQAEHEAPRDKGDLAASITAHDGVVTTGVPYAAEVHGPIDGSGEGQRSAPRFVPIDQLLGWSLRHGLSPWTVQWSIATKGTPYQPFIARALAAVRDSFPDLETAALEELRAALLAGG